MFFKHESPYVLHSYLESVAYSSSKFLLLAWFLPKSIERSGPNTAAYMYLMLFAEIASIREEISYMQ